jgi:hypothetical protein
MASYFLDEIPQKNDTWTVRSAFCPSLPDFYDRIYLGEYDRIGPALKRALHYRANVSECVGCCAFRREPRREGDAVRISQ